VQLDNDFATVGDVLNSLWQRHKALRDRVLTEQGEIRQHVNIFVGSDDVKRQQGLQTAVKSNEIHIFNAVSGG
jgi:molybdopterin synthase sulfur carrier subunit